MAKRELNPTLRMVLELGPVLVYLAAYFWFKDRPVTLGGEEYGGVVVAMAVFVPLSVLGLGISWALTGTASRMAVFTVLMVMVFGGITVWMNDATFAMMRPTVVYGFFAAVLALGLYGLKRSYLQFLMGTVLPMRDEGWRIFTRNWIVFFVAMAIFNEFVWRVLGETAWVWLDTVGQFVLTLGFLATQMPVLQRHAISDEK
ncbi:septation protein IspZ [Halovulum dunhuangense]|uniref:Inner membrane-spanning protein YciB n=1 Tax=Halovulum dunhuangense TaxID=1505036 RepID=A0A849L4D5_9RHOB|nr:inner membrane-spanning protein YciB [Halovulum dunhuangense]NNU81011.1 septation protein IspZ [Halovulum dunhuangense]